jgi:hypothetical protein
MTKFRRKYLSCGCCGAGFYTWPEYVDQDQDAGYGICQPCQEMAEEKNNEMLDHLGDRIRDALRPENQAKWDRMDQETRRLFAMKAIDDGMVVWTITRDATGIVAVSPATRIAVLNTCRRLLRDGLVSVEVQAAGPADPFDEQRKPVIFVDGGVK